MLLLNSGLDLDFLSRKLSIRLLVNPEMGMLQQLIIKQEVLYLFRMHGNYTSHWLEPNDVSGLPNQDPLICSAGTAQSSGPADC